MSSSWSRSGSDPAERQLDAFARRFADASRRAEIISSLNCSYTEQEIAEATVDQLCEALEAESAFVAVTHRHSGELSVVASTGLPGSTVAEIGRDPLCRSALGARRAEAGRGENLLGVGMRHLLVSPWHGREQRRALIGVGRLYDEAFDTAEIALVEVVSESVGHALERAWIGEDRDRHAARQGALARAATGMTASLVPHEVLQKLALEVAAAFEADAVAVFGTGGAGGALKVLAVTGSSEAAIGAAEDGFCRHVAAAGKPLIRQPTLAAGAGHSGGGSELASVFAAPLRVSRVVEGVVLVAYQSEHWIESEDLDLLVAFADLTATAWRNAAEHAAVRRAAELDSLTGCLNHGAFQERLCAEMARSERTGMGCTVVLLDLNDFKAVNDTAGHLAGDALLRQVAERLLASVRPYDSVSRYGGDEFALLLPATDEYAGRGLAERVLAATATVDLPGISGVSASAGVAGWRRGDTPNSLIARADDMMLDVKRARVRLTAGEVADPGGSRDARERRRLGRLAVAARIGAGLSRLLDEQAVIDAAILELSASLGYEDVVVVRLDDDNDLAVAAAAPHRRRDAADGVRHSDSAQIAEALRIAADAVRERRTVLSLDGEPRDPSAAGLARSALRKMIAVPVYVGGGLWGAIVIGSPRTGSLDDEDAQLVQSVADHLGNALRAARVYDQLEQTHVGIAAALAAALEAKDAYTADHARAMAELAVAVGIELGLDERQRRALRYGAIFHDIGKIAIPDAILNKAGPLDESEIAAVHTHPEVGEQILSPVPFLADVREIVRHDHERWDGAGYPDGLQGEQIPLGARIVLVADAYHAMRSDRPYRKRLSASAARTELLGNAGTQFDSRVVHALLRVLERQPEVDYAGV